jgi:3'-5' exoribonuclease
MRQRLCLLYELYREVIVKTGFVADLSVGMALTNELFMLQDVTERTTKDGRAYLLCTVQDKSGQMGGVFWSVPPYVQEWVEGDTAVFITGRVVAYKGALQINITDLNPATGADLTELLPTSHRPQDEMVAELQAIIATLDQPWQELVTHLLLTDAFLPLFSQSPAARNMHHAYIGGLLEHTLSMAAIGDKLAAHYPYVNRNLLLAGVLLHDMGKTKEYSVGGSFELTDDGRLVGHIVRAIVMVEKAAATINFPQAALRQLVHLIAAHHGNQEWGSPVTPKSLEAVILHQIDLLDSRVQGFLDHIHSDTSGKTWTTQNSRMFHTPLQNPKM